MTTEIMHRPTPEFRDFLEGEFVRVYRRDRSFARLRFAAILLGTLAAGDIGWLRLRSARTRSAICCSGVQSDCARRVTADRAGATRDQQSKFKVGVVGQGRSPQRNRAAIDGGRAALETLDVDEIQRRRCCPRDD
jgi:hypothetical protein